MCYGFMASPRQAVFLSGMAAACRPFDSRWDEYEASNLFLCRRARIAVRSDWCGIAPVADNPFCAGCRLVLCALFTTLPPYAVGTPVVWAADSRLGAARHYSVEGQMPVNDDDAGYGELPFAVQIIRSVSQSAGRADGSGRTQLYLESPLGCCRVGVSALTHLNSPPVSRWARQQPGALATMRAVYLYSVFVGIES